MGTKYKLEEVKNVFEENNCKLLSDSYVNNHTKLNYICECGNEAEITFKMFLRGQRCMKCSGNIKYTNEEVNNYLNKFGYKLLSDYLGADINIKIECNQNHIYEARFVDFKRGHRCPKCAGLLPKTYKEVAQIFLGAQCILLEKEYKNCRQKLHFQCNCGGFGDITLRAFLLGVRCKNCYGEKLSRILRYDYNFIVSEYEKEGYKVLDKEYYGSGKHLKVLCPEGTCLAFII
jgi:uncharacterized protein with PIN domain